MAIGERWQDAGQFAREVRFYGGVLAANLKQTAGQRLRLAAKPLRDAAATAAPLGLIAVLAAKDQLHTGYRGACAVTAAARLLAHPGAVLKRHGAQLDRRPLSGLERAAYLAEHETISAAFFPYMGIAMKVLWPEGPLLPREEFLTLRTRWSHMLGCDMADVGRYYSRDLIAPAYGTLHEVDVANLYAAAARIYLNARDGNVKDPAYRRDDAAYAQINFHYMPWDEQTARAWNQLTEVIFQGGYGPMQRRVIAPIVEHARAVRAAGETAPLAIVEFGCGTGRTAEQLLDALHWNDIPTAYRSIEMSAPMAAVARRQLQRFGRGAQIAVAPAEHAELPPDAADVVLLNNLLHEVPPQVRATLLCKAAAALKPGGIVVVLDSAQYEDNIPVALDVFQRAVNEPCFDKYASTPLAEQLRAAGLIVDEPGTGFFAAKRVVAHKPKG